MHADFTVSSYDELVTGRESLCHGDNSARHVKVTPDPRLTDVYAPLAFIVDAHMERGSNSTTTLPAQRSCACRAHIHGAERPRSKLDRLTADTNHIPWCTGYRF